MAISKLESLRRSLAITSSASRRPSGLALGAQLRRAGAGSQATSDEDDEHTGVEDLRIENNRLRKQVNALRKQVEDLHETPVARTANSISARSRVLVQQAQAIDELNRQLDALESRSIGGVDLSMFSEKELVAYGFVKPNAKAITRSPGTNELVLGLLSPEQAQSVLEQVNPTSHRRAR